MRWTLPRRAAPRDRDRGATLVEAVVVMAVVVTLALGTIEFGNAWRQATVVDKTMQQSARVVASVADQPLADYEALQTFRSLIDSSRNMELDYLVIYRSSSADGVVPAQCQTQSVLGLCNRYLASDLVRPSADFGSCSSPSPDRYWCPATRTRDREPLPDYVGVYARLQYTGITNMLPGGLTLTRHTVYAVEPCAFGLPGC